MKSLHNPCYVNLYIKKQKLKDERTIAVSNFYMHKDIDLIAPDYYCIPPVAYTERFTRTVAEGWMKDMVTKGRAGEYFFSIRDMERIEGKEYAADQNINYFYCDDVLPYYEEVDLTKKISGVQTVPILCIELAVYMGFQEIVLLGVDFTHFVTNKYTYFYDRKENIIGALDDSVDKEERTDWSLRYKIAVMHETWRQFENIRKLAEMNGAKIYNASPGSMVDIFEKRVYDSFFFIDKRTVMRKKRSEAKRVKSMKKEKIVVYGIGNFYRENEKEIHERYDVVAYIDKNRQGKSADREIIGREGLASYTYDKILIMIFDIQACMDIARELIEQKVSFEDILLGHDLYGDYSVCIDRLAVLPDGRFSMTFDDTVVKVRSKDEFNNVYEGFVDQIYHYFINDHKKDVIFDVGMNIGDTSLYFLKDEKVEKIYAYEPFMETYLAAEDNLQPYLIDHPGRIEIFQYGISNEDRKQIIGFNNNMTCGQSTIADVREKAYQRYEQIGLVKAEEEKEELIEVKRASEVFLPIMERYADCNIILKMNCEGEEYNIIEDLARENILHRISFIMLEWHDKGKGSILQYLTKAGFSYWCKNKTKDMGFIYAYHVKEL